MNFSMVLILAVLGLALASGCAAINAEKNAPPIGQFVAVNGERMHLVDTGINNSSKPPVVLIHGASVNLRDMKIALGDELAKDRRVIMIDRPGRGYSSRPDDGYQLDLQAQYIRDAIDELGVEKPVIVGQSFGGAVALAYALQYQEDIAGLVVLAPVSHQWPGGVAWYNTVSGLPIAGFLLRRLVIPIYGQLVAKGSVEGSFAPGEPPDGYAEQAGIALIFRPKDFKANASDIRHLKREIIKQQDRYGELTVPMAIVAGDADTTVSPKIHAKTLAKDVAGAKLTLLPDTGHTLHHAETAKILAIIEEISTVAASPEPLTANF